MMKTIRFRSGIALIGGIMVTMVMLLDVLSNQSVAQTTREPVQDIAAGDQHALATGNSSYYGDGVVWAWGDNA
jgi:hypothetical protein